MCRSPPTRGLLTGVLRDQWGFDGPVVADYFGVAFLHLLHHVATDLGDAAVQALTAGIDIELPTGDAYLAPLAEAIRAGRVDEAIVDRAVLRVLRQKQELGLLDATFDDEPPTAVDLDSPEHRALARRLAEESVVLLRNDGVLPLAAGGRIAVIGPNADRAGRALRLLLVPQPRAAAASRRTEAGIEVPTVLDALRDEFGAVSYSAGCAVDDADRSGFAAAVAAATEAEVAVLVMGDHAGLFGRGTVGEGCDRDDLELPGVQRELIEAVAGHRYAHGGGAGHRAAVRGRLGDRSGARRSCRRSSPARRVPARSPGCSPAGSTRPGGCRSACRARPGRSRTRTCTRRWARATR